MNASSKTDPGSAALHEDVAALKRDVAKLLEQLKANAKEAAGGAGEHLDESAQQLYRNLAAQGEESLNALSRQVEKQPLLALLVAFGVGYILGRVLSR